MRSCEFHLGFKTIYSFGLDPQAIFSSYTNISQLLKYAIFFISFLHREVLNPNCILQLGKYGTRGFHKIQGTRI